MMTLEQYNETNFRPDREFVDGELEKRNLGQYDHARLQGKVYSWFDRHEKEWNIRVVPEQRIQVSPTRVRIADVTVLSRNQEIEQMFTKPPLLAVEILSPRDTLSNIQERVNDFLAFGVRNLWILDPKTKSAYRATDCGFQIEEHRLDIFGTQIYLNLKELFEGLD